MFYNNAIVSIMIILNILNIIMFRRKNLLTTAITIALLVGFFMFYDFSKFDLDPLSTFLTMTIVSFAGPFVETIIIHFTNGEAWRYGYPLPGFLVPLWLLPGYGMLGLACLHSYQFFVKNQLLA